MKKSIISAILYVVVIFGAYTVYAEFFQKGEETSTHGHEDNSKKATEGHNHEDATKDKGDHGHGDDASHSEDSEVEPTLQYDNGTISISLKDKDGNAVEDLEVNHEKLLHLIVVDEHLDKYYHLHPEDLGNGKFEVQQQLPDGVHKAFIDIKPKNLSYEVQPISFNVGEVGEAHGHGLKVDSELTQSIDGKTVTVNISSYKSGESVTLDFELDESELEPYLGAMGHVVILDEHGEKYLHVHPEGTGKPVFGTQFNQPGIYKIWAEFKQDGVVRVFPFVIEVK